MPLPPALTPEQRHAALQKAAECRRQRAEIKAKLKQGSLGLDELFDQATRDDALAKLKVVSVLESLPGVGKVKGQLDAAGLNDNLLTRQEAIILSMTPLERVDHGLLDGSRRRRIASGSGTKVEDVNRLVKQFLEARKMMTRLTKSAMGKRRGMW